MGASLSPAGAPIYLQLAQQLDLEIRAGYQAGELLPSEGKLTERFGVNRHTLRRALEELIRSGLIERKKGVGSYVLDTSIEYPLQPRTRFTATLAELGHSTGTHLLQCKSMPASGGIARTLKVPEGTGLIWLETLRIVDERPFCLISHFLPQSRFPDLIGRYAGGSLHALLEQHYKVPLRRESSLIRSVQPHDKDARLLCISQRQSVLHVKSVILDARSAEPVEYALTRFRGDRVQLFVDF